MLSYQVKYMAEMTWLGLVHLFNDVRWTFFSYPDCSLNLGL